VEDIVSIIRTAKLTPENTRVICSQNEESLRKNLDKLPDGFGISRTLDELKPISFYTSTCFEGQDIIDPNGRSFIVSHAQKEHTMLDISTTFIQICGRIRNSDYNDEIVHLYSTSRYLTDVSLETFEQATYKALEEAELFANWLNSAPDKQKPKVLKQVAYMKEPFIKVVGNEVMIDRNMANFEIVNYKIVNNIYQSKSNVIRELTQSGANITNDDDYTTPDKIQLLAQRKISFKDLFELYCTIVDAPVSYSLTPNYRLEQIESKSPLVKQAYNTLGKDEVRRMKYHQSNIKRELIKRSGKALDYKIVDTISETIQPQIALPVTDVKQKLQSIYDDLRIERRAKATDLKEWYEIKEQTKTINGKSVAYMTIIRPRFVRLKNTEDDLPF
jgi:hypothetical protein